MNALEVISKILLESGLSKQETYTLLATFLQQEASDYINATSTLKKDDDNKAQNYNIMN